MITSLCIDIFTSDRPGAIYEQQSFWFQSGLQSPHRASSRLDMSTIQRSYTHGKGEIELIFTAFKHEILYCNDPEIQSPGLEF